MVWELRCFFLCFFYRCNTSSNRCIIPYKIMVTPAHWEKAISYTEYRAMIDALVAEGKTTGEAQSTELLEYTRMNIRRMSRWDKTGVVNADMQTLLPTLPAQKWLVLTEGWCGDAAQNVPMLVKFAELNPQIEIRFLLRDEHLDLMDLYLTNGGRSIPRLIAFEQPATEASAWHEFFVWGPRPEVAQDLVMRMKAEKVPFAELAEKLHKWYSDDQHKHLQADFYALLQASKAV
ncbi:MAG: thioredoxin family protein [Bacteroidetes bacterium]|nr:MAG: thioredoxin family protein [Bacteroidota bacterium]